MQDKLVFSFLMCINLQRAEGAVEENEWLFLVTGGAALTAADGEPNPASGWLPDSAWNQLQMLGSMTVFQVFSCFNKFNMLSTTDSN